MTETFLLNESNKHKFDFIQQSKNITNTSLEIPEFFNNKCHIFNIEKLYRQFINISSTEKTKAIKDRITILFTNIQEIFNNKLKLLYEIAVLNSSISYFDLPINEINEKLKPNISEIIKLIDEKCKTKFDILTFEEIKKIYLQQQQQKLTPEEENKLLKEQLDDEKYTEIKKKAGFKFKFKVYVSMIKYVIQFTEKIVVNFTDSPHLFYDILTDLLNYIINMPLNEEEYPKTHHKPFTFKFKVEKEKKPITESQRKKADEEFQKLSEIQKKEISTKEETELKERNKQRKQNTTEFKDPEGKVKYSVQENLPPLSVKDIYYYEYEINVKFDKEFYRQIYNIKNNYILISNFINDKINYIDSHYNNYEVNEKYIKQINNIIKKIFELVFLYYKIVESLVCTIKNKDLEIEKELTKFINMGELDSNTIYKKAFEELKSKNNEEEYNEDDDEDGEE